MALKALMLRKKISERKNALDTLKAAADFEKRETELAEAIEEAKTEEEQKAVEEEVEAFEKEKAEHEEKVANLEKEVADLEEELQQEESRQREKTDKSLKKPEERKEEKKDMRKTNFYGMSIQERDAFFADEKVVKFLGDVRTCIKEKRALTNVGLTVPEVMLELMRQVAAETSKLMSRVNIKPVAGTARQVIMGDIPEAVWTEMCAKLNELALGFNDVEVDGYKVGGYFAVCNAILEDNDVNLASEIINALGKAIGKAVDKAIVYGTGTKMPLGVVTRLAQTEEPDDYPATARAWVDLHTKNLITGSGKTGIALFKEIALGKGVIKNEYSESGIVWVMNEQTHTELVVEAMDKNASAAIVSGMGTTMPVVGGEIVELPFIPDGDIVFGYFDKYLLAERAGTKISQSEHARFIEDQTVFKGTARYDGVPVIAEAFGVINIKSSAPTTSVTFPADTANA